VNFPTALSVSPIHLLRMWKKGLDKEIKKALKISKFSGPF